MYLTRTGSTTTLNFCYIVRYFLTRYIQRANFRRLWSVGFVLRFLQQSSLVSTLWEVTVWELRLNQSISKTKLRRNSLKYCGYFNLISFVFNVKCFSKTKLEIRHANKSRNDGWYYKLTNVKLSKLSRLNFNDAFPGG